MALKKASTIWMNGRWVPWDEAASTCSRTWRTTPQRLRGDPRLPGQAGPAIFRLDEHMDRLMFSPGSTGWTRPSRARSSATPASRRCRATSSAIATSVADLTAATRISGSIPTAARSSVRGGLSLGRLSRRRSAQARACRSRSARGPGSRPIPLPAIGQGLGNYMNSQLMKMEALVDGYSRGAGARRQTASSARAAGRTCSRSSTASW